MVCFCDAAKQMRYKRISCIWGRSVSNFTMILKKISWWPQKTFFLKTLLLHVNFLIHFYTIHKFTQHNIYTVQIKIIVLDSHDYSISLFYKYGFHLQYTLNVILRLLKLSRMKNCHSGFASGIAYFYGCRLIFTAGQNHLKLSF